MSGQFREACVTVSAGSAGFSGIDVIPKSAHTQQAAHAIGAQGLSVDEKRNAASMNDVAARLLSQLQAGTQLSLAEFRDAIWCLWDTTPALSEYPEVLRRVIEEIDQSTKRKLFRALATVYLVQFRIDRPALDQVSAALQRCALRWGEPFASYQQDHALYDPVGGPKSIAAIALRQNISPVDAMRSLGLGALDAQSGFTEAITRNLLIELADGADPDPMNRVAKVRAYALDARNELIFKGLDLEIAEALMKPFLAKPPEKAIKDNLLNFIVSIFRDPRTYPGRWERFPHIKAMVVSWLTEQSLRQFLDVVGRTIDDRDDQQMWLYRRAFWEAAHRKGIIKGAWVIFAEDGARLARKSFGNNTDFGIFNGGRAVQRTHAVLLLEVGRGIVADWSHNGKVNIWSDATEQGTPKLYQRYYTPEHVAISRGRSDVDTPRYLVKTHSSPKTYSWQRVVAERIFRMTNTRLQESDYRA